MQATKNLMSLCVFICMLLVNSPTSATILTFDQAGVGPGAGLDPIYGDNVTSILQSGHMYGIGAEGFTPNVSTNFVNPDPNLWTTGYGDLVNVVYEEGEGTGNLQVVFTAEAGFAVTLHSFELGGFNQADYNIASVQVLNGSDTVLANLSAFVAGAGGTHSDYVFAPPLSAPVIKIRLDSSNLGGGSDNIGMDNIVIGQVIIPEPTSLLVVAVIGIGVCRKRPKRNR